MLLLLSSSLIFSNFSRYTAVTTSRIKRLAKIVELNVCSKQRRMYA